MDVSLRPIDDTNRDACAALTVTELQAKLIAPNSSSGRGEIDPSLRLAYSLRPRLGLRHSRLMKKGCAEVRSSFAGSLRVSLRYKFFPLPGSV